MIFLQAAGDKLLDIILCKGVYGIYDTPVCFKSSSIYRYISQSPTVTQTGHAPSWAGRLIYMQEGCLLVDIIYFGPRRRRVGRTCAPGLSNISSTATSASWNSPNARERPILLRMASPSRKLALAIAEGDCREGQRLSNCEKSVSGWARTGRCERGESYSSRRSRLLVSSRRLCLRC